MGIAKLNKTKQQQKKPKIPPGQCNSMLDSQQPDKEMEPEGDIWAEPSQPAAGPLHSVNYNVFLDEIHVPSLLCCL